MPYFLLDIPYAELTRACQENMARQEKFSGHITSIMLFLLPSPVSHATSELIKMTGGDGRGDLFIILFHVSHCFWTNMSASCVWYPPSQLVSLSSS